VAEDTLLRSAAPLSCWTRRLIAKDATEPRHWGDGASLQWSIASHWGSSLRQISSPRPISGLIPLDPTPIIVGVVGVATTLQC
jgi:hypothetical protein